MNPSKSTPASAALVGTAALLLLTTPALARDWWREAPFPPEEVNLDAGIHLVEQLTFGAGPNPQQIQDLTVIDNATGASCRGWIGRSPSYAFELNAPHSLLQIRIEPLDTDTSPVIVIRAPDNVWRCDDGDRGRSPTTVDVVDATEGVYEVWAGSLDGSDHHDMALIIEAIGPGQE